MKCPRCSTACPPGARFCTGCGIDIESPTLACNDCGEVLPAGAQFCSACGHATGAETRHLMRDLQRLVPREYMQELRAFSKRASGDRRFVTILFFDITGSTSIAESLDPEDVRDIINAAFDELIEPIPRYGGTLARLMGDGVLAFFGAPIAHEDDEVRACRAGLEILQKARNFARRLERERGIAGFDVRVGINTGLVVVGEVGTDLRVEYTAMGDAVNVAARMEAAAEPGSIYLTEVTANAVASVLAPDDLGEIAVKGKAAPVHAYRLRDVRTSAVPSATHAASSRRIVGRTAETEQMQAGIDAARAGAGGVVVVSGPAGVGKSRLIHACRENSSDLLWVETQCPPFASEMSYWSARDLLRSLAGVSAGDDEDAVRNKLRAAITPAEPVRFDVDEAFCLLAALLDLQLDLIMENFVGGLPPEEKRRRTIACIAELVRTRASQRPLVVVWEDVHWSDPSSFEVLQALASNSVEHPALIIATTRSQAAAAPLLGLSNTRQIEIGPLDDEAASSLLKSVIAKRTVSDDAMSRILTAAEGNALFLEEVGRVLTAATVPASWWT